MNYPIKDSFQTRSADPSTTPARTPRAKTGKSINPYESERPVDSNKAISKIPVPTAAPSIVLPGSFNPPGVLT